LEFGYRLDIDPHEDLYRIIAIVIIIAIMGVLAYKTVLSTEHFYGAVMMALGYLCGRVRGKKS